MKTLKYFLLISTTTLLQNLFTFAQPTAQLEQSFFFSDEINNSQELILGYDPFGTDGLDPDLGEEFIPQVPPGEFGVRFQIPVDTSITTIKDIRFGCYWATGYSYLIDLNYAYGSSTINITWEWNVSPIDGVYSLIFYNPYNNDILDTYSWQQDSSYFEVPFSLDKIIVEASFGGTLSWDEYELYTPNGGETINGGEEYNISWWSNELSPWLSIEFSSDSGNTWETIDDSVWTLDNSYQWEVPSISSDNCLVRLGNYPCKYDISDSVFSISYTVSIRDGKGMSLEFSLKQNYPNPFNPTTTIRFTIPDLRFTILKVYDVLGNEVTPLVNEEKLPGIYEVVFDGSNLPNGIYFYKLSSANLIQTRKMVLLK